MPRRCRYSPCMLLKSTTLEITGRNVFAARLEKIAGDPGRGHGRGEGHRNPHHPVGETGPVVLEPDLDTGDQGAHPGEAGQAPLEATMTHVLQETIDTDKPSSVPADVARRLGRRRLMTRISVILSRNRVLAMVAFRG